MDMIDTPHVTHTTEAPMAFIHLTVPRSEIRTVMGHFSLCGEGLCIGYDSADPVSSMYTSGFPFTGGTLKKVVFDIADDAYIDIEGHLAAAMARD